MNQGQKYIRKQFLFFIPFIVLTACTQQTKHDLLLGSWRLDSIYNYYNGFGFTLHDVDEEPLYHYQQDGKLRMTKDKESRFFMYEMIAQDTLFFPNLKEKFLIVKLTSDQLMLKKEKRPVFKGGTQERYEIKFFSRIE